MFQPTIRSTLSSETSLVILCWSSRVSQTSFLGRGTSSGRPFSGQQTINIKTFNTLFFLSRDIFLRHTISLLSCYASEGVTNWLIPSKNLKYKNLKTRNICRINFGIVCVCVRNLIIQSLLNLRCHWANEADFRLRAFKQMFLKEWIIEP